MTPDLAELDLVLFLGDGFLGWAISLAQRGMRVPSPQYCHVGTILTNPRTGQLTLFQTNPPQPTFRDLGSIDWSRTATGRYIGPAQKHEDIALTREWAWNKTLESNQGGPVDPYGFWSIVGFAGLGLLGAVWPAASRTIQAQKNPLWSETADVCSQITDDLFRDRMNLVLVPGIGLGQMVPGDLTASQYHKF